MGGGDPLLLGAIGIWVGPQGVVIVMLVAALLGLGVAAIMAMRGGQVSAGSVLPLGTFMALAAWPVFLLG
jgi:leader peptidase (prepilin peptidase)/N-methyltransferase